MALLTLEEIRDVLQHRRKHCRDLLELSQRQHQFIDAGDYTQLMSTLAQKQRILGRLDEMKRRYPELSRQWTALRDSGLPTTRNDCESLIAETETILAELLESEKLGTEHLSERREATRRQIEAVSQGVHVNQVYADTSPTLNHRFLNTNG
jgi:FlgN protein